MRKVLISAAAAVSALAFAAPAAAQWAPAPPYGNAYGNYGQVRALQVRIDRVQQQINRLDNRNILSGREANRLRGESRQVEQRLRYSARYGLNQREFANIDGQIRRLEGNVWREANDRDGRVGSQWGYNNNGWVDRDRDGRNDGYEDDRGYHRD
jgi:opacity protein-like surface antigen